MLLELPLSYAFTTDTMQVYEMPLMHFQLVLSGQGKKNKMIY